MSIRPGHSSRLDGRKAEKSGAVRRNAPIAGKAFLDLFFLGVTRMSVFAFRIRLPDFYDSVRHRIAFAVKNAARDFNAAAGNTRPRQIVPIEPRKTDAEKRANGLPGCCRKTHDFSP